MSIELPNYHVLDKLGVGAESRVFRARCMRTGKDYAVKIVKLVKPEDAGFIELLRAEHAIGSAIQHPVLRKVFELRMIRQRLRVRGAVLFMEYVDGLSMSDKEFRRPIDDVLRYFIKVAEALQAMHSAGYVHADLKPNNILVTSDDQVKLIDFGQSARIHGAKSRVQGTIDYIAPEQVQRGVLDQRTDVFGLGAALHRVLTKRAIATEMNQTVSMHSQALVGKRLADVRESATEDLPPCVSRLIEACCKTRPEDRIADMSGVIDRINLARTILAKPPVTAVAGDADDDTAVEDDDDSPTHELETSQYVEEIQASVSYTPLDALNLDDRKDRR